jgi:histidine triad (HIT) family protein
MRTDPTCVFCRIAKGEVPATVVAEMPMLLAVRDANPQAPDHVLVLPREHIPSLADCQDVELLGDLLCMAHEVARKVMIDHGGYRVVVNVGAHGGQTVPHLHLHVLGGRRMKWPPG